MRPTALLYIVAMLAAGRIAQAQPDSSSLRSRPEVSCTIGIQRLSICSSQSDFSPFVCAGTLYFVSERSNRAGVQYADSKNRTTVADIYSVAISGDLRFRTPKPLPRPINSTQHEGPVCLADSGRTIYFTSNEPSTGLLKIYRSNVSGNHWTKPEMLTISGASVACCHPCLSTTGDSLIFSAMAPGGKLDIFYALRKNGEWQTSKPLARVNTGAHEGFPFIAGHMLYFASDRDGGKGGLDLYVLDMADSAASPVLLPEPINSSADDFGICTDSTMRTGYFSTNRVAARSDDIYYFSTDIPDFSAAKTPTVKYSFCYTFFEETSMMTADTAELTYEWDFGDGAKARGLKSRHCYNGPGTYPVSLNVVEKVSGEIFNSRVKYDLEVPEPERLRIAAPDTVEAGKICRISSEGSSIAGFSIERIFWSFGDGWYNTGAAAEHTYGKPGVFQLELWIIATNSFTGKQEKFRTMKQVNVVDKTY